VQRGGVKPGADLSRVTQLVTLVVTEQQRSEVRSRTAWCREAADDQLLTLLALELQPVSGTPGGVRAVGALGDQPLPALAAGFSEERLAVAIAVRREAQRPISEPELGAQKLLPGPECERPNILPVQPENVEDVEEHRHVGAPPLCEPGKAGLPVIKGHHLAVDREPLLWLGLEAGGDCGIAPVQRQVITGQQMYLRA